MTERVLLPDGLDDMPPGPELAALLASIDQSRLNGHDCVRVVCAAQRLRNQVDAVLLAAVAEIGRRVGGGPDAPIGPSALPDPVAATDEVSFALRLTRPAADRLVTTAEDLITHPGLRDALSSGVLDLPRVRVIADAVRVIDNAAVAASIVATILPQAPELPTGRLTAKLNRLVLHTDPEGAIKRRERAIRGRRVEGYPARDGTATLTALGLPVERAAAALHRLSGLADSAKQAGDARTRDQLRADLLLDLLDGTWQPPASAAQAADPAASPDQATNPGRTANPAQAANPAASPDQATNPGRTANPGDWDPAGAAAAGMDQPPLFGDPAPQDTAQPSPPPTPQQRPGGGEQTGQPAPRPQAQPQPSPAWRWPGGLQLIAPLHTLLGLADTPGEIPGWGPIAADAVRQLAGDVTGDGRFQIKVLDRHGRLVGVCVINARHRRATAAQARHVRARDNTCRAPGCRMPAYRCEIDHQIDYAHGGPTHTTCLQCLCKTHHKAKHLRGLTIDQPEPGLFKWTSKHGHTYWVREEHPGTDPPDPDEDEDTS